MPPTVASSARSSISLTGRLGLAGQLGGDVALDVGAELAAVTAAHVLRDALHLVLGQIDHLAWKVARQLLGRAGHGLRRRPDGQAAVLVPLGDQAVRLQALVADARRAVVPSTTASAPSRPSSKLSLLP